MDMARYSARLREQLEASAAAGTPKAQEAAAHLATALDPAAQLLVVEALSDAAAEISRELAPGSVDLRVRGTAVDFIVTAPDVAVIEDQPEAPSMSGDAARTTLRIPDELKQRAETAAAAEGMSLNSWLVRAVTLQLDAGVRSRRGRAAARMTGWAKQAD